MSKILVVSTKESIRQRMIAVMQQAGYHVEEAESVADAVERLKVGDIEGVVCDRNDGSNCHLSTFQPLHEQLNAQRITLPMIVLSQGKWVEGEEEYFRQHQNNILLVSGNTWGWPHVTDEIREFVDGAIADSHRGQLRREQSEKSMKI